MAQMRVRIPSVTQQSYYAACNRGDLAHVGSGAHQAARVHAKENPGHDVAVTSTVVTVYRAEVTS